MDAVCRQRRMLGALGRACLLALGVGCTAGSPEVIDATVTPPPWARGGDAGPDGHAPVDTGPSAEGANDASMPSLPDVDAGDPGQLDAADPGQPDAADPGQLDAADSGQPDTDTPDPGLPDGGALLSDAADPTVPDVAEADVADGSSPPIDVSPPVDVEPCGPSSCVASQLPVPDAAPVEPPGLGGCPAGMTLIPATPAFCVDRWEAAIVAADGAPLTPYAPPPASGRAMSAPGVTPHGHVSGTRAASACAASGKRLCTDAEWLRACKGPEGWTYPYGPQRIPGRCNDARACHPAIQYFNTSAAWIWSELNHPCLNQLPFGLESTGTRADCVTPEGVYDLMGNLHEWTSDPAGTFRGGFYVDTKLNGNGCLYATTAHDASHYDYSTGFRCCANAPP